MLLFDLVATKGAIAKTSKAWIPLFTFESIVIVFLRSNGIAIEAILLVGLLACAILNRKRSNCKMLTVVWAIPAIAIAASLLITGPIYNALGISPNEKVEGLGIPLNQMARVVAYDGDMSESDKEYMSSPTLFLSRFDCFNRTIQNAMQLLAGQVCRHVPWGVFGPRKRD